jgi:hypothetical protein
MKSYQRGLELTGWRLTHSYQCPEFVAMPPRPLIIAALMDSISSFVTSA